MIQGLIFSVGAGILGLYIATKFVPGIQFQGEWTDLLIPGLILGILISAIKPVLGIASFLLRMIAIGAVSLGALWILNILFPSLMITGFVPLIITAGIITAIAIILSLIKK